MIYLILIVSALALAIALKVKYDHLTFRDEQNKVVADLKADIAKLRGK